MIRRRLESHSTRTEGGADEAQISQTQRRRRINITPVHATNTGFGTIHSSDSTAADTSNVNFTPGSVDPNFALVQVGADKQICFTNSETASVNIIIDQLINAG